ncbi:hypothetical protein C8F04DRAFT_1121738, partial [Mycena alexandri]
VRAGRCVASPACVGRAGLVCVCVTSVPHPVLARLSPPSTTLLVGPIYPALPESLAHPLALAADAVTVRVRVRSIPAYVEGAEWMCGVG